MEDAKKCTSKSLDKIEKDEKEIVTKPNEIAKKQKKRVESIKELQTKLQEGVKVKLTAHTKNTKAVKEPVEELRRKQNPVPSKSIT